MEITWSNKMSVGVKYIDDQHQELIRRINSLLDAFRDKKGAAELEKSIKYFEAYAQVHFQSEEDLMKKHAYPEMQSHMAEHEYFRGEIASLRKQFDDGVLSDVLMNSLRKLSVPWFLNHVDKVDRTFGSFLKARGIKG